MWRRRFSLRAIFIFATIIGVALTIQRVQNDWYQRSYAAVHLWSLLANQIQSGDSKEEVAQYFDSFRPLDKREMEIVRQNLQPLGRAGMKSSDEFYYFDVKGQAGAWLQFRNDKLVNHQADAYANPVLFARLNGMHYPSWLARNSSFNAAMSVVVMCLACWAMSIRNARVWIFRITFFGLTFASIGYALSTAGVCFLLSCIGWGVVFGARGPSRSDSTSPTYRRFFLKPLEYAAVSLVVFVHAALVAMPIGGLGVLSAGWIIIACMAMTRRMRAIRWVRMRSTTARIIPSLPGAAR